MTLEPTVNILLVDDRPENLLALRAVLEDLGQHLVTASSGKEALKQLLERDFAVILLDVQMPEMDGFETAALIRQRARSRDTPIIFLTAINKSMSSVARGYRLGAIDYVFKPFMPEVLKSKVAAFVDLFKKTRQLELEIEQRSRAEEEVRSLNEALEQRVAQRTGELEKANEALRREIQERKQLESELHQRARELAEADRRKDEFLAMLAHELRNPLAPMLNALQVMQLRGHFSGEVARAREVISRQAQHMARLVDDLLDVSRITRGRIELRKSRLDLRDVVQEAVDAVRPVVVAQGHEFRVALPPGPLWVEADSVRLEQVATNLINNAAKYTPRGGNVSVTLAEADGQARLTVRDDGEGIPPDLLPRIFDLFTQAHRTLDRSKGGLGIGLTVVKNLVEMHGGTIAARSDGPGKGSEFEVCLPLSAPPAEQHAGPSTSRPAAEARRVLVVDDNEDALETMVELLCLCGHSAEGVQSGQQALRAARRLHPDVILLDIGLPEMDGYEVAGRIRADKGLAGVMLVAVTGYGHEQDQQRAREAGFDHHLTKPVEPAALLGLIGGDSLPLAQPAVN